MRSGATGKAPDALVGRRLETHRDGVICADLGAFRLIRNAATLFAGPLDLITNHPRQNGSISSDQALYPTISLRNVTCKNGDLMSRG